MERAGFMTCTAANHQGAIKEPAASLFTSCETHPPPTQSLWLCPNPYSHTLTDSFVDQSWRPILHAPTFRHTLTFRNAYYTSLQLYLLDLYKNL